MIYGFVYTAIVACVLFGLRCLQYNASYVQVQDTQIELLEVAYAVQTTLPHTTESTTEEDVVCYYVEEPEDYEISKALLPVYESDEPTMHYFGSMEMTAYVATGHPCADGSYPSVGYTVACNDSRLWHKTIYIEGYGIRYVHDTGGMASNVIDLFVGSLSEAYQVGRRNVEVYIVDETISEVNTK